jgi:hypothetical protein
MNPEDITYKYYGSPEAYSKDPNVFERTLLTEQLHEVAERARTYADAGQPREGQVVLSPCLSESDYKLVLEDLDKLGAIGFIETPGLESGFLTYLKEHPEAGLLSPESMADVYNPDDDVKQNILYVYDTLFYGLSAMDNVPENYSDELYSIISKYIVRGDQNAYQFMQRMLSYRIVPESPELVKEISRKLLESYDIVYYKNFIEMLKQNQAYDEEALLTSTEIHEIAVDLKSQGLEYEGEEVRKYARYLRQLGM